MEALNRLADNSDNWQPRKTRYEPCLSVSPTRITRPLPFPLPQPHFQLRRTSTSSCWQMFLHHLKLGGRGLPPTLMQSRTSRKEKRRRRRRRRNFFERYRACRRRRNFFLSFANATRVCCIRLLYYGFAGSWWIAF